MNSTEICIEIFPGNLTRRELKREREFFAIMGKRLTKIVCYDEKNMWWFGWDTQKKMDEDATGDKWGKCLHCCTWINKSGIEIPTF